MTGISIDLAAKSLLYVGLLFGGQSGEHDVSITSAKAIASALSLGCLILPHSLPRVIAFG